MLKFSDSGWITFDSDFGTIGLSWTPLGISRVELGIEDQDKLADELSQYTTGPQCTGRPKGTIAIVIKRLKAHLKGKNDSLLDIPLNFGKTSDFSQHVWKKLQQIAPGTTITYGELAQLAGKPKAARAIGRIMGANPVPLIVPCHRCLGKDGSMTGFSTEGGIELKARLLFREGYEFDPRYSAGIKHLSRRDPVMKKIIKKIGPYRAIPEKPGPAYESLLTAIVHQQLSVKAGQTIAGRVRALTPGPAYPKPDELLALDPLLLRGAGLSNQKVSYVRDLALCVASGQLKLNQLAKLSS